MSTFARIVNGVALDVAVTPPTLASRFHPDWLAANPFTAVPDNDTNGHPLQSGAVTLDGGVSFTNPAVPALPVGVNTAFGSAEYKAAITRQAIALAKKGSPDKALLLLKQKGF